MRPSISTKLEAQVMSLSIDAAKAFDKLWSELFYKLIPITKPRTWRLLHCYYKESYSMLYFVNSNSETFKIKEEVKQGGIL